MQSIFWPTKSFISKFIGETNSKTVMPVCIVYEDKNQLVNAKMLSILHQKYLFNSTDKYTFLNSTVLYNFLEENWMND